MRRRCVRFHQITLREVGLEDQILFKRVLDAIQYDLTEYQRHVIILCRLEEFSLPETPAIPGKGVRNVKVIQTWAIAKLRHVLEQDEVRTAASSHQD